MYFSHRSEPIRQRGRAAGYVGQSLDHAAQLEATVEAIGEGAAKVFSPDRFVGAVQGGLDISQHCIDPGEFRSLDTARTTAGFDGPVSTGLNDRPEAVQPIRGHFRIRRKEGTRPAADRVAPKALD